MKKIIYSLLSILLCGLQSCVDLDMAPYNQVASGNMWSNAALTNQGVAGVYAKMRGWGVYSTSYSYNVVPFDINNWEHLEVLKEQECEFWQA